MYLRAICIILLQRWPSSMVYMLFLRKLLQIIYGDKDMKYRKKPVYVEAIEWTGANDDELEQFVGNRMLTWTQIQT